MTNPREPMIHVIRLIPPPPTQYQINLERFRQGYPICEGEGIWVSMCPGFDDIEIWLDPKTAPLTRVEFTEEAQRFFESRLLPAIDNFNRYDSTYINWVGGQNVRRLLRAATLVRAGVQELNVEIPDTPPLLKTRIDQAEAALRAVLQAFIDKFGGETGETPESYS